MGSNEILVENNVELLQGYAEVYKHALAYADTLVLRAAVELRIADIIHAHGQPMSLFQIAAKLETPTPDVSYLARLMRVLVQKAIFTIHYEQSSKETLYGLTTASKWLLHDQELSLAPLFLTFSHPVIVKPWFEISRSINEGGIPFEKAHGMTFWEMTSKDSEFNKMFNAGMAAYTEPTLDAIVKGYNKGFSELEGTLVDVGGAIGRLIAKIVEVYPHIKGINFELPHVVGSAPPHPGVTHVGGDMFKEIPSAHNVIIKSVLHNWADEDCIKILKNCQKAVSQNKGKVLIVEIVLHPHRNEMFDDASMALDLLMMTNAVGGKERTEKEWKVLLNKAGFTHFNIIQLQSIMSHSIIEAFCH